MKHRIAVICPFCEHEQGFDANSDEALKVTICSSCDYGPGAIKERRGCGRQFLVKTKWLVKATVAQIVWPTKEIDGQSQA